MKTAIIGAGPAGCAAAYAHKLKGHEVILLEKDSSIGGRTQCYRNNGFTLDTGAGFVTNFYPMLKTIAQDLQFEDKWHHMHRSTGLFKDGKIAPLNVSSALSFASFPFLSTLNKFKMLMWIGGLTLKRGQWDLAKPSTLADIDVRSIAECARAELNEEIYHTIIRPGIEPFWYFSCEEVSQGLVLALSSQAAGARFYSFPDGIDTICEHLTEDVHTITDAAVVGIEQSGSDHIISYKTQQELKQISVEKVVIATTASVANNLVKELPESVVSTSMKCFLSSQRYASNVHACVEIPKLKDRPPAGALFPCDSGKHNLAAISFHSSKYPKNNRETELISIFLSDKGALELMHLDDEKLYEECWSLAKAIWPKLPSSYSPFHLVRRNEAIPVHEVGRYKKAANLNQEQQGKTIRFCGDYLATATIEGAIQSGLLTTL